MAEAPLMASRVLVVVPTRNRAALAARAIQSILADDLAGLRILVSDNSTQSKEVDDLEAFCAAHPSVSLSYMRPPSPLPMAAHWAWAMEQARKVEGWSHVTYLTDRMVFKAGHLRRLGEIAGAQPSRVITYNHDRIDDYRRPVVLEEFRWSGKLFEVNSSHLLYLSSIGIFHPSLPRMLNSVVPRATIEQLGSPGRLFGSIAPDYGFAYQCLGVEDSILYFDRPALIHYAIGRSNGASSTRGTPSADGLDFIRNMASEPFVATPVPALLTTENIMYNEYLSAQSRATNKRRFPAVDVGEYFASNRRSAARLDDPELAAGMTRLLDEAQARRKRRPLAEIRAAGRRIDRRVWKAQGAIRHPISSTSLLALQRATRAASSPSRARSAVLGHLCILFDSVDDAILHANRFPRPPTTELFSLLHLLHPRGQVREVPLGGGLEPDDVAREGASRPAPARLPSQNGR